ncbi:KEOPS complex subunit Pcc1 [Natrinema longum]|uniref:KEOPS complex Pcc1-like subunit n=1 Tax=Natrinema longum TaxID=370324 RepID=A0A8A2U8M7_9EURY|nr:KEOPS complex subunit Pcc1 [Natrinema longum]MBZ6494379.1 KEOPS complex Pcc1-like subunit [Natrinema longum]QSW84298.1 KEOPS complex Pcc1-like subunit [Natrinema longum]
MSRRATIRTAHDDAALVARAISPDNTDEMTTTVERDDTEGDDTTGRLVTRIDRETTSGLQSTVDDYVVNLEVAIDVASQARAVQGDQPTDTGPVSDHDTDSDTTHNE